MPTKLLADDFGYVFQSGAQEATNGGTRQRKAADTAWGQLNERALANLDMWVPKLFLTAKHTRMGGYRVKSADLGRGYEEDLSLTAAGIKYFGVADQGDPRQGRRTPIDIVMEWEHLEFGPATLWLVQALGEQPEPQQGPQVEEQPQPEPEPPPAPPPADDIAVAVRPHDGGP
jgi:putative DNA primase/helicase